MRQAAQTPQYEQASGEFSEQILSDLIAQGYEGQALLQKFIEMNRALRPAVKKMLQEADELVKNGGGQIPTNKLFGTDDI